MNTMIDDGIRKAAILIAALDRDTADQLLDRMAEPTAQAVRHAVFELDEIDPVERDGIVREFLGRPAKPPRKPSPRPSWRKPVPKRLDQVPEPRGVANRVANVRPVASDVGKGLSPRVAAAAYRRESTHGSSEPDTATTATPTALTDNVPEQRPFHQLREADTEKLAGALAGERPQTVAVVLSHLSAEQAGQVLVRFPAEEQSRIVRRLIALEETDPEILGEIERTLETRLSEQVRLQRRRVAGLSAVASILDASRGDINGHIRQSLMRHDRELAEKLAPEPVAFEELASLGREALVRIFQDAGAELVTLALVGAEPAIVEPLLDHLSPQEAAVVRGRLRRPGPTRLRDVEEARRRIARLAHGLAMAGLTS